MEKKDASRREFVRKAAYIAPAIVTLAAAASYAKAGSDQRKPPIKINPTPLPTPVRPPV